ncbi:hypothetical protein KIH77_08790 [Bifidobacterium sp. 82T24]|uniref:hypothetical protein n=1 Tax=Bifidobacterium pluvialisilvae TaxID=2834436 RepID=UPI001C562798|nr:hypothetical protein [Bifidobacterium pluvialisilvae]MBW3088817.1 hypothetical protein [Bifidobacterium pluvialisilvae]
MVSGGARTRSGPAKDPNSRTSARAGYTLMSLPNGEYDGPVPGFPLGRYRVMEVVEKGVVRFSEKETRAFRRRELSMWKAVWRYPQAWAWSMPQYSYMVFDIAMYCRSMTIAESSGSSAADRGLIPRYADRIGLSADGLARLGWRIAPDELAQRRMERGLAERQANDAGMTVAKRRLRA